VNGSLFGTVWSTRPQGRGVVTVYGSEEECDSLKLPEEEKFAIMPCEARPFVLLVALKSFAMTDKAFKVVESVAVGDEEYKRLLAMAREAMKNGDAK